MSQLIDSRNVTYANFWQSELGERMQHMHAYSMNLSKSCAQILSRQKAYEATDMREVALLVLFVGILLIGIGLGIQYGLDQDPTPFYIFGTLISALGIIGFLRSYVIENIRDRVNADIQNNCTDLRQLYESAMFELSRQSHAIALRERFLIIN